MHAWLWDNFGIYSNSCGTLPVNETKARALTLWRPPYSPKMLDLYGMIIFALGAGYTAWQLHRKEVHLKTLTQKVWDKQENLYKTTEDLKFEREKLGQNFDWKSNLPMILSALRGKDISGEMINDPAVQNLIENFKDQKE